MVDGEKWFELNMKEEPTVHGNATNDILTKMLLEEKGQQKEFYQLMRQLNCRRTETSRTSFWPLLVVSREFRIAGSLAPSNLTIQKLRISRKCPQFNFRVGGRKNLKFESDDRE